MNTPKSLPPDPNAPIKLIAAAQLTLYAIHEELCTWVSGRCTFIQYEDFPSASLVTHTFTVPGMIIGSTQAQLVVNEIYGKLLQGKEPEPVTGEARVLATVYRLTPVATPLPLTLTVQRNVRDSRGSISISSTETTPGNPKGGYTHTIYIWFGWL